MNWIAIAAFLICAVTGCTEIQHTAKPQQQLDKSLLAGVGDVVLRLNKKRNLENVLGKSDIFGRKTNEGYVELRYAGVEPSGEVVLARKDVQIISNETTMSRTPFSQTTGQANTVARGTAYGTGNAATLSGSAITNYQSTTIAPISDFHVVVPSDAIAVRLPPGETALPVEGFIVEIVRATPNVLEYSIREQ